jgi:UDP-N-acetylmuramate--alanine ligase
MRTLPLDIGVIHFVGIGGIGMSGIAEILRNLGHRVQGSDQSENANVRRLAGLGVATMIGHRPENLGDASVVVVSSAIRSDNPELMAARERHLPVVRRAEMLAELMRLKRAIAVGGTHGKTTTTSLCAAMLDAAGLDPTVINGGIINAYGANAKVGQGDWMVVEADESDGTFLKLRATCAIVTNIDPEHLDHYGSFDAVRRAFREFVESTPFYGFAAVCTDHPEVQALAARVENRRLITYGVNPQAEVRAERIEMGPEGCRFDAVIRPHDGPALRWEGLHLPMAGHHNVLNALAALAVARELGVGEDDVRKGLAGFGGVRRRFTTTGVADGVRVIDDYGHHPVEIAAVLRAARAVTAGKVLAVVQPHRYSRLKDLFQDFCSCFNDADTVIVSDVYAAGETPLSGASRDDLVEGVRRHGHRRVLPLSGPDALAALVKAETTPGDLVVCLGAGDITAWAYALPGQLEALSP